LEHIKSKTLHIIAAAHPAHEHFVDEDTQCPPVNRSIIRLVADDLREKERRREREREGERGREKEREGERGHREIAFLT
jgi:hypothetical protein